MATDTLQKMCKRKVRFVSREQAARVALKLAGLGGTPNRSYECPICRGFHLTRQMPKGII
jgi:hypothetical protein